MAFLSKRPHPGSSFAPMLALLAVVLALLLYLRVLDNAIYGPALALTQENSQLRPETPLAEIWQAPSPLPGADAKVYRPLLISLLRVQAAVWGTSPSSFHAMNLVLLAAIAVLLTALVCRLTGHAWARAAAVFGFLLHPLLSQSVQSVSGQGGLLATGAMLGAGVLLLAALSGGLAAWIAAAGIAPLAFVAAGAHEMGLLLPCWLLLLAAAAPQRAALDESALMQSPSNLRRRKTTGRTQAAADTAAADDENASTPGFNPRRLALFVSIAVLLGAGLYLGLRARALGGPLWTPTPALNDLYTQAGLNPATYGPAVMLAGLTRLLWPAWPSVIYEFGMRLFLPTWAGWVALALLLGAAVATFSRARLASVALLMLTVTLAALAHWIPSEPLLSEQALLFAIVPVSLLLAAAAELLIEPQAVFPQRMRGRLAAGALICIALGMAWQTRSRSTNWRSELSLWQAEAARHPESFSARLELLRATMRAGDAAGARRILAEARTLEGTRPQAASQDLSLLEAILLNTSKDLDGLRALLQRELDSAETRPVDALSRLAQQAFIAGETDLARKLWEKELSRHPQAFMAQYELAEQERTAGNLQRAAELALGAVKVGQGEGLALAYERLGIILVDAKQINEAKKSFDRAITLDPSVYLAYIYRARIFMGEQDMMMAEDSVERAIRFSRVTSYTDLAQLTMAIYEARGDRAGAISRAIMFANRFSSDVGTSLYAARYLISKGEYTQARQILERTARIAGPRMGDVLVALGMLDLYANRDLDAAIRKWKQARQLDPRNTEATRLLIDAENVYRRRAQKQEYEGELQRLIERSASAPIPAQAPAVPSPAPAAAQPTGEPGVSSGLPLGAQEPAPSSGFPLAPANP